MRRKLQPGEQIRIHWPIATTQYVVKPEDAMEFEPRVQGHPSGILYLDQHDTGVAATLLSLGQNQPPGG